MYDLNCWIFANFSTKYGEFWSVANCEYGTGHWICCRNLEAGQKSANIVWNTTSEICDLWNYKVRKTYVYDILIIDKTYLYAFFVHLLYLSQTRGKKTLEQLSRPRFFPGFEIYRSFLRAKQMEKWAENFKTRKKSWSWKLFLNIFASKPFLNRWICFISSIFLLHNSKIFIS